MDNIVQVNFNLNKKLTTCLYNDNILEVKQRRKRCKCCDKIFRYYSWNEVKYCNSCIVWRKKRKLSIK